MFVTVWLTLRSTLVFLFWILLMPPTSTLFPYTTLFRSGRLADRGGRRRLPRRQGDPEVQSAGLRRSRHGSDLRVRGEGYAGHGRRRCERHLGASDRPGRMGETYQGFQDPRRGRIGFFHGKN